MAGPEIHVTDETDVKPAEPPKKGVIQRVIQWVLQLKVVRAYLLYSESRGTMLADSITYRALFGVFAGVLLGFSIAARYLSDNPEIFDAIIDAVDEAIPGLIGDIIDPEAITAPAGLSLATIIGAGALIWAAMGAISSLRLAYRTIASRIVDDLNTIWIYVRNLLLAAGIGVALLAAAAITFLSSAGLDMVGDWIGADNSDPAFTFAGRVIPIAVVFLLDTLAIAVSFRVLIATKVPPRALWSGAFLGAIGLVVLQQLSGLFVGGADSNPLLASFASLIALLLWFNFSAQVILIAGAYIVTGMEEHDDRIRAKYGAATFAQRKLRRAENAVMAATTALKIAQDAAREEREQAQEKEHEKIRDAQREAEEKAEREAETRSDETPR